MKSKKLVKHFLILVTLVYITMLVAYYIVNPLFVFEHNILKNYKFNYLENYSLKLYDKLKKDQYNLVFGTSRSHLISSKMLDEKTLNMHNIYGNPHRVFNFLKQLNNKQIKNIKHIYFLLDLHTLKGTGAYYRTGKFIDYNTGIYKYKMTELFHMNKYKITSIFENIMSNKKDIEYYLENDGSMAHLNESKMYNSKGLIGYTSSGPTENFQEYNTLGISGIKLVNDFCKKNNIIITYYTPTFIDTTLNVIDFVFEKDKILKILNYTGINGLHLLWYVEDVSNLQTTKNKEKYYKAFFDNDHLNYEYTKKVFLDNVFSDNKKYYIHNENSLDYIFNKYYKEYIK